MRTLASCYRLGQEDLVGFPLGLTFGNSFLWPAQLLPMFIPGPQELPHAC